MKKWDVFISHASEDKADFVEPLASSLAELGLRVWYDGFTLSVGDRLGRTIDKGLAKSSYGLVVLSPAFISKGWPENELRGLTARGIFGGKAILPIWHDVTVQDLRRFSPPLADKFAIDSSGLRPLQIAVRIIKQIRPDIFTRIARLRVSINSDRHAKVEFVDPKTIKRAPVQHAALPADLIGRIRLVRACFLEAYPHTMEFWLDGFMRDSYPSREVGVWEHFAATFMEYCALHPQMDPKQRKKSFGLILAINMSATGELQSDAVDGMPERAAEEIRRIYKSINPPYDFEQARKVKLEEADSESGFNSRFGKEQFLEDLPDELIRKLISVEGDDRRGG